MRHTASLVEPGCQRLCPGLKEAVRECGDEASQESVFARLKSQGSVLACQVLDPRMYRPVGYKNTIFHRIVPGQGANLCSLCPCSPSSPSHLCSPSSPCNLCSLCLCSPSSPSSIASNLAMFVGKCGGKCVGKCVGEVFCEKNCFHRQLVTVCTACTWAVGSW